MAHLWSCQDTFFIKYVCLYLIYSITCALESLISVEVDVSFLFCFLLSSPCVIWSFSRRVGVVSNIALLLKMVSCLLPARYRGATKSSYLLHLRGAQALKRL